MWFVGLGDRLVGYVWGLDTPINQVRYWFKDWASPIGSWPLLPEVLAVVSTWELNGRTLGLSRSAPLTAALPCLRR